METIDLNVVAIAKGLNESQEAITKQLETKASKNDLDGLNKSIKDFNSELENQTKSLNEQGKVIQELKEKSFYNEKNNDLKYQIKEKVTDGYLKDVKNKRAERLILKVPTDISISSSITGGLVPQAQRIGGYVEQVSRKPFITDLVTTWSLDSPTVEWVEETNRQGGASFIAEGASKPQASSDLVVRRANAEKIPVFANATSEMLNRVSFARQFIDRMLRRDILLGIDAQVLSGDGTGNNLTGILENATPFDVSPTGAFYQSIQNANKTDVLRVAIDQVDINLYNSNYIVLHPSDATSMDLEKTTEGHYTLPPFVSSSGLLIKGVPVITNIGVTLGEFLVGDFNYSNFGMYEDIEFDLGYINENFIHNIHTVLAEASCVHWVANNHYGAFVSGTFSTAIAAIDKP